MYVDNGGAEGTNRSTVALAGAWNTHPHNDFAPRLQYSRKTAGMSSLPVKLKTSVAENAGTVCGRNALMRAWCACSKGTIC
jgi:hypothetical protein